MSASTGPTAGPPPPSDAVARPAAEARYATPPLGAIVIAGAPVGSGRTALLSHLASRARGGDARSLWILQREVDERGLWPAIADGLVADGLLPASSAATLAEAPARTLAGIALPARGVLVLIEASRLDRTEAADMADVASTLAPELGIAMALERHPAWDETALVAGGRVRVLDRRDLWLSRAGVAELWANAGLAAEEAELVTEVTGGWPALVRLALEARLRHRAPSEALDAEAQRDFVFGQVASRLASAERILLGALSMVSQAPVSALEGEDGLARTGTVAALARGGLVEVDAGRAGLPHPLRRLLRPVAARLLGDGYRPAAARMARVATDDGDMDAAVHTFLDAGDVEAAVTLVTAHADRAQRAGRVEMVSAWLDRLPDDVRRRPALRLIVAWDRLLTGEAAAGERLLLEVVDEYPDDPGIELEARAGRCFARRTLGDLAGTIALADETLADPAWGDRPSPISRAEDLLATVHVQAALARFWTGDDEGAARHLREASALDVTPEHPVGRRAPGGLARIMLERGRLRDAEHQMQRALGAPTRETDPASLVDARLVAAELLLERGAVADAAAEVAACLQIEMWRSWSLVWVDVLTTAAHVAHAQGAPERAHEHLENARQTFPRGEAPRLVLAITALEHARIELYSGEISRARAWLAEAAAYDAPEPGLVAARMRLRISTGTTEPDLFVARALSLADESEPRDALDLRLAAAQLLAAEGNWERGLQLLGAASAQAERWGLAWSVVREGPRVTTMLRELANRETGPPATASQGWLERLLTLSASLLAGELESTGAASRLTKREREVANLLRRDRSVTQVATELYVSENTVKTHIKHLYRKLGVTSRAELRELLRRG